jgi:molybdenum cofactor cytidylyltransferase
VALTVTGLVLAAGGSKRLGQPKQLLPYGASTLLDHVLGTARSCEVDQLLCVIGGTADAVRESVDFEGIEVVENPEFGEAARRRSQPRSAPWIRAQRYSF